MTAASCRPSRSARASATCRTASPRRSASSATAATSSSRPPSTRLAQIERTLVGVIQKVAESRGMNLVLHRQQVALNVNEFDITEQVTEQLNKILPSVVIPPDGVSPAAMVQNQPPHAQPAQAQPVAAPAPPAAPAAPPKK